MKLKLTLKLTTLLLLACTFVHAQSTITVEGTVTDQSNLPLPGVNVIIKGVAKGTQTDFDGNYSIEVSPGQTLVFSYIGLKTVEKPVAGQQTINVQMEEDTQALEEVVVTAQGIKREQRSLGYSVSKVYAEEIEDRPEGDIGRVLRGKAAGINITATNGLSGSGTNIIIRGFTSITGSNQPLFVVNGVPFDGASNQQNAFFDNVTESSRFLDIDPNSIESVNVLKGLSASVLYGERGRNGVILITTKNGSSQSISGKTEVSVSQSYFISDPILPKYQNKYGGGFHQNFGFFFSNFGPSFDSNDLSNQTLESNNLFIRRREDGVALLAHPFSQLNDQSLISGYEDIANSEYPYIPYNGVEEFFRQGGVVNTSVNIRGGNEKASFNMNYGYLEDKGFTPGNKLTRNTFGVGGNAILSNKFTINGALNFSTTNYKTPPVAASTGSGVISSGSSVFGDVLYTPRSVDLSGLPYQAVDGRSLYYRSGNDIQNPYWTVANAKVIQATDRIFGNFNVSYAIRDWLNVTYRLGIDTYTEFNSYGQNKGGVDGNVLGVYRTINARNTTWDHNLIFNANKDLTDDLNLKVILGLASRRDLYQQDGAESTQQLVFGILEHYNFVNSSTSSSFFSGGSIPFRTEVNTIGAYSDATIGYKNFLYFNGAVRTDWSSTLERENQSITYPGASLSFIPTSAFSGFSSEKGLNYLKLRVGYGTSAGFPNPYGTRNFLALNSRLYVDNGGNVLSGNAVSNRLGNPNLKPERVNEIEAGIDSKFFNNKLGLNVSLFKRVSKDLITDQNLDPSTGYTVTRINAGELETKGVEIDFDLTPIRNPDGFNWNISGNFYADESTITALPEGTDQIALTGTIGGRAANYAVEGQPYGIILGNKVVRTNGQYTVDSNGDYLVGQSTTEIIGDPNPDWTTTLNNLVSYKGFSFNMSWQYRHGGDIYSQTAATLVGRGVVAPDNYFDGERTYVLPGVKADGSPNDIQLTRTRVLFNNLGLGAEEFKVYDGTTIRLSEISLGYSLPKRFLEKTPFGSLSFTLSGSNMWFKAVNFPDDVNFDTNNLTTGVGNGQGIDFFSGPNARRYGLTVKASF
ncbi:SusC/RagA family TonB-linked outer membrane protein [Flagellimonas beolgyonensis]|uniref:SusC/RagA family TonB-linked outer membrane protein n=1 Tax=Flagellimonas beolgyonensis TaxID=864064 RepID=UPI000F8D8972|nr:SusC/RagA family TonB-linked outer membrane protein [Allomuricauda beolgyonensis]